MTTISQQCPPERDVPALQVCLSYKGRPTYIAQEYTMTNDQIYLPHTITEEVQENLVRIVTTQCCHHFYLVYTQSVINEILCTGRYVPLYLLYLFRLSTDLEKA